MIDGIAVILWMLLIILAGTVIPTIFTAFVVGFPTLQDKLSTSVPWIGLVVIFLVLSCSAVYAFFGDMSTAALVLIFVQIILYCAWPVLVAMPNMAHAALGVAIASTAASGFMLITRIIRTRGVSEAHVHTTKTDGLAACSLNFACNMALLYFSYTIL